MKWGRVGGRVASATAAADADRSCHQKGNKKKKVVTSDCGHHHNMYDPQ